MGTQTQSKQEGRVINRQPNHLAARLTMSKGVVKVQFVF